MKSSYPNYEIRLHGHLSLRYSEWFGLSLEQTYDKGQPITVLTGPVNDQSALHGVLGKIQAMGLTLLEVKKLPT